MLIRDLQNTPFETLVECILASFKGYFVEMPTSLDYWTNRFKAARVNFNYSFGVFDDEKLVAFIINGIDREGSDLTAFNTGTGVLPAYRGQKWVDQLYAHALPHFQQHGITKYKLEVIDKNHKAIRVYERIGFQRTRRIKCYKGTLPDLDTSAINLQPVQLEALEIKNDLLYSWDHQLTAINQNPTYTAYSVWDHTQSKKEGYIILNPENGYVAQLETNSSSWEPIFAGIRQLSPTVKINNIDAGRKELIAHLSHLGIENVIDQYEMELFPTF